MGALRPYPAACGDEFQVGRLPSACDSPVRWRHKAAQLECHPAQITQHKRRWPC